MNVNIKINKLRLTSLSASYKPQICLKYVYFYWFSFRLSPWKYTKEEGKENKNVNEFVSAFNTVTTELNENLNEIKKQKKQMLTRLRRRQR